MYTRYDNLCFSGHARMQTWQQGACNWAAYSEYNKRADHEVYTPATILNLIIKGQKRMYDGNEVHHLHAGDVFIIPAGTLLCSEILGQKEGFTSINLILPHEWVLQADTSSSSPSPVSTRLLPADARWQQFSQYLLYHFHKGIIPPDGGSVIANAISLLSADIMGMLQQAVSYQLSGAMEVIGEELSSPTQIADLARQSCMSKATLKRKFKQLYHTGPMQWVWQKRLERSCFQLRTTHLPIQEIAYSNGFENITHFYRLFRKAYGMTPKDWREQN